mmetsp:Transcript_3812/g.24110  ORF Transcript_3812/g.24110 Transcript_3812/m.24110 type:complete len:137 (-) Transcript_3812:3952-4362(-)
MRNSGGAVDETAEGCFSNPFQELVCNDADSAVLVSALSYVCLLCLICSVRGWLLGETNAAARSREGTFPRSKVCTVGVIGTPVECGSVPSLSAPRNETLHTRDDGSSGFQWLRCLVLAPGRGALVQNVCVKMAAVW